MAEEDDDLDEILDQALRRGAPWLIETEIAHNLQPVFQDERRIFHACQHSNEVAWHLAFTYTRTEGYAPVRIHDLAAEDRPRPLDKEEFRNRALGRGRYYSGIQHDRDMLRTPEQIWVLPHNDLPNFRSLIAPLVKDEERRTQWAFGLRWMARHHAAPDPGVLLTDRELRGRRIDDQERTEADALAGLFEHPPGRGLHWTEVAVDDHHTRFMLDLTRSTMPYYEVIFHGWGDGLELWFVRPRTFGRDAARELVDQFTELGVGPYHGHVVLAIDTDAPRRGLPPLGFKPKTCS